TLLAPGLAVQRLTTREPDDSMIEVAIASLKRVLTEEGVLAAEVAPVAELGPVSDAASVAASSLPAPA
ncbi:MAG TPA: DUF1385 domain-containing protein, partial [Chloroflexota bacterium]|nr:DUF1385 domain-containing protein [Chloroflexota bacterium]